MMHLMEQIAALLLLELIVGKENAQLLSKIDSKGKSHPLEGLDLMTRWRLLSLYRRTKRWLDLIIDIHGSQIFRDGMFNGDPRKQPIAEEVLMCFQNLRF